jgi:hypothetical protein
MAREYNPQVKYIGWEVKRIKRGGSIFWAAVCEKHGTVDTAASESEATVFLGLHMQKKHRGETLRKM